MKNKNVIKTRGHRACFGNCGGGNRPIFAPFQLKEVTSNLLKVIFLRTILKVFHKSAIRV